MGKWKIEAIAFRVADFTTCPKRKATVATAHALAQVVYRMLTLAPHASAGEYKVEYEPLNLNEYQKRYEENEDKRRGVLQ